MRSVKVPKPVKDLLDRRRIVTEEVRGLGKVVAVPAKKDRIKLEMEGFVTPGFGP